MAPRNPFVAFLLLLLACPLLHASELSDLITQLRASTASANGIGQRDEKIATQLQHIGAPAIPFLLPLLKDSSESVRNAAAYTLRDTPGLTAKDLPLLMESQRRDDGWLPIAIARIGTPEASAFLVDELVRTRQDAGQVVFALGKLGPKAVPDLLKVYNTSVVWDQSLERAVFAAFQTLGAHATGAVAPLSRIASDEGAPLSRRVHAIDALGAIGLPAAEVVPALLSLRQSATTATLRDACTSAIKQIGASDAVPLYLENLNDPTYSSQNKVGIVTAIASMRTRGETAGPMLVSLLDSEDWDLRLESALALGAIGYRDSIGKLTELLNDQKDWRIVYAAAQSLDLLQASEALPTLRKTANNHWYPPVRVVTDRTIHAIETNHPTDLLPSLSYFEFQNELHHFETAGAAFPIVDQPNTSPTTSVLKQQKDGSLKSEELRGARVNNGFLSAEDLGEWGGQSTFINSSGISTVLIQDNTKAIYGTKAGALAIVGGGYSATGSVYRLTQNSEGKWKAEKWRTLPGTCDSSHQLKNDSLLLSCTRGLVLLAPDGRMRSLTKPEADALLSEK